MVLPLAMVPPLEEDEAEVVVELPFNFLAEAAVLELDESMLERLDEKLHL